jgi:hypothetical protein
VIPLQQATRTVPIVFVGVIDPVGSGLVASLSRPGGNLTGFLLFEYALAGKSSAIGTFAKYELAPSRSGLRRKPDMLKKARHFAFVPCVDGSRLARVFFTCSAGRCSHVFGLFARITCPLAIMPSADQVPVKRSLR